jgi:DNA-binding HxlR family transcriptional regulator
MRRDSWSEDACPIARTMSVLGQPWAALIVREAMLGRSRFSEFRHHLGVASDVLSARLAELVTAGVLELVDYQVPGDRRRSHYVLTDGGRGLITVLAAMGQWGRVHLPRPDSCDYRFVEAATGEPAIAGFHRRDGRPLPPAEVTFVDRASA